MCAVPPPAPQPGLLVLVGCPPRITLGGGGVLYALPVERGGGLWFLLGPPPRGGRGSLMPCLLRGGGGVSGFSFDPHLLERPIASGGPCSALGDPWHRGRVSHAVLWVFSSPWLGRGPFCLPAPPPAAGGALVPFRPPIPWSIMENPITLGGVGTRCSGAVQPWGFGSSFLLQHGAAMSCGAGWDPPEHRGSCQSPQPFAAFYQCSMLTGEVPAGRRLAPTSRMGCEGELGSCRPSA